MDGRGGEERTPDLSEVFADLRYLLMRSSRGGKELDVPGLLKEGRKSQANDRAVHQPVLNSGVP